MRPFSLNVPSRTSKVWALATAALIALAVGVPAAQATVAAPGNGRAWEIVTPPDSNGAEPVGGVWGTDPGGNRILYFTWGPTPNAPSGSLYSYALATRGQQGWDAKPLGYPYQASQASIASPSVQAASADFSNLVWGSSLPLLDSAPADRSGLYRAAPGADLTLMASFANEGTITFAAASDDGQHVPFETTQQLLPADAGRTNGSSVYEFVGNDLRLVSVDDNGDPLSACGATVGFDANLPMLAPNPVSRDGERIFMTSPDAYCEENPEPRRVYLRAGGTTTVEVSASQCTRVDCNAPQNVSFMGATPNGSVAFLATAQQLTDDDVDQGVDLYRYDVAGGQLERVSVGPEGTVANVQAKGMALSDDGSGGYFLAEGALVPGSGVEGQPNLYLVDDGELKFVATLSAADLWPSLIAGGAEAASDGEQLLFSSIQPLVAEDTDVRADIYRYDAGDGQLTLVSIGPDGGNGDFEASMSLGPFQLRGRSPHSLSSDGQHAFFTTPESLVSQDTNGAIDVYEWLDGQVALVSSGGGNALLIYGGASADGASVFFTTSESLVARDRDGGNQDLYVARAGGGFADPEPPPADCAEQDTCPDGPADRLDRRTPRSVTAVEPRAPVLRVGSIGRSARRRIATTGRVPLAIRVPVAGSISIRARARVGGHLRTVARRRVRVTRAGELRVRLRLSSAARKSLARGHRLSVRVALHHSQIHEPAVLRVTIPGEAR